MDVLRKIFGKWKERRLQRSARWLFFVCASLVWWFLGSEIANHYRILGILLIGAFLLETWRSWRIPVLTFHSVSSQCQWLKMPDLVVSLSSFEHNLKWLKSHGYRSLTMDELYEVRKKNEAGNKLVALTFDDGFLDSWVAVAPLLREYGLKGTVFVSTGWIEDDGPPRPQVDTISPDGIQWEGYLNPTEIRLLKNEGVLDVQSHGVTHDRIFKGGDIRAFVTDVYCPLWVYLLLYSEYRTSWYKNKFHTPPGYPIFSNGEALAVSAFYPDPDYVKALTDTAGQKGFFDRKNWRMELMDAADVFKRSGRELGKRETRLETLKRWREELVHSKLHLEEITGGDVSHFCWPRTAWHRKSEHLALECGYRSTTAGRDHNSPEEPWHVSRVHISAIGWYPLDLTRFVLEIWVFKGHYWAWPMLWIIQKIILIILRYRRGILV